MFGDLLNRQAPAVRARELFTRSDILLSYSMTCLLNMAGFLVIPHISSFVQFNLGYPRSGLGALYMAGGCVAFVGMRSAGWATDRFGAPRVVAVGTALAGSDRWLVLEVETEAQWRALIGLIPGLDAFGDLAIATGVRLRCQWRHDDRPTRLPAE